MKIRERHNSLIAKLLRADAIVLYPFIFYAGVPDDRLRRHEWAHVEQIRKCGYIQFYVTYLLFYLAELILCRSHHAAYMSIPWEEFARNAEGVEYSFWKPWERER